MTYLFPLAKLVLSLYFYEYYGPPFGLDTIYLTEWKDVLKTEI